MEIKKTFVQGKMNRDVDERLLPDGQYPDALNVRVSTTDSSHLGAVQNIEGNTQLTTFSLTNAHTIGAFADGARYKLYWFITSDEKDMVIEFNTQTQTPSVLLESNKPNSILNFNENYLITGVAKVVNDSYNRDLLAWTDDRNNPRCINIERSKTYLPDGFVEDDICLIKKPPKYALKTKLTFTSSTLENNMEDKFLSFAYRYKYLDGEYSTLSTFTNYQFSPKEFDLDYQTMENNGMVNAFNAVKLTFNTGSKRVTDIEIVYKESNSNTLYMIQRFNKSNEGWTNESDQSFTFSNDKKYKALPPDELLRVYDNVPRVAKALELIGNRFLFANYVEGYNLINIYGEDVNLDYSLSLITKELTGQVIPVTFSGDQFQMTINLTGIQLITGTRLNFSFEMDAPAIAGTFSGDADYIINQDYTDANALATDPDFIFFIEDVVSNIFNANYAATPPPNASVPTIDSFEIVSATSTTITLKSPIINYEIDDTPSIPDDDNFHTESFPWRFKGTTNVYFKNQVTDSSLKTNRSYEVGIIYRDQYCRTTPVLTDAGNTLYIPQDFSVDQNKLKVTINHLPPLFADTYKLVVKQSKGEYQTIYTNVFYQEGIYRWVLLEGANKDKVHDGDTLIVKSDLSGPLPHIVKLRVLEVSTKPKDFIADNKDVDGNDIIEEAGLYMKIKPVGFDMTFDAATSRVFIGHQGLRYPSRCFTNPAFGENVGGVFVPYPLKSGSRIRIFIQFGANGNISFEHTYDKRFRVQTDYPSIKDWFFAEVQNLGQFGIDYTWNGVDDIGPNIGGQGAGMADAFHRFSGWDFTTNGEQFWVVPWRKGTAARDIYTDMRWEVFFSDGDVIFETEPEDTDSDIYYETEQTFDIISGKHKGNLADQTGASPAIVEMDFFNCFVQGNGAESYRYKDKFNAKWLNIDLRPSTTTIEKYREVRHYADMTYGEPYSSNTNQNGLNEFNLAKANFKDDLEKRYGSIQKLFARESNVLVMQEDKIGQVFYGKDLLYNADGTTNLASIDNVLGEWKPYMGEYGISRNPESFVFDGFNIYFTDVKRGAAMRLAGDGLNEISAFGMKQFFKDRFKLDDDTVKKAGFDPYFDELYLYDSNEIIVKPIEVDCGQTVRKVGFTGNFDMSVNYGITSGSAGFSFISDGKPIRFTITIGDQVIVTGFYGDILYNDDLARLGFDPVIGGPVGSIMFDKSRDLPVVITDKSIPLNISKINVYGPLLDTSIQMDTLCPIDTEKYMITMVTHNPTFDNYSFNTKTNWIYSGIAGEETNNLGNFSIDGNILNFITGFEGIGKIPKSGSEVKTEMWFQGNEDNIGSISYLLSDELYDLSAIPTILGLATTVPVTNYVVIDNLTTINVRGGTFTLPSFTTQYLYLIYNYDN